MMTRSQAPLHSVGPYVLLNLSPKEQIQRVSCYLPNSNQPLEALVIPIGKMKKWEKRISALASVTSERVGEVVDIRRTLRNMYIICEKHSGLSLQQCFGGPVDMEVIKGVLRDCLEGLADLHMHLNCHGNLSPSTVLIDNITHNAKLSCFAAISSEETEADSEYYQAPEVLRGQDCSKASDIYSLGCIAGYLETGRAPYSPKHCSYRDQSLFQLVCLMTREKPESRPSAEQLLEHPFFSSPTTQTMQ